MGALPPLHQITKNVGIELPEFLGKLTKNPAEAAKILEQAKKAKKSIVPSSVSKSSADLEIENLLNQNKELLNTFDKNNDGIIDYSEINFAVQKAKVFSQSVLKNNTVNEWYYYSQERPVGQFLERSHRIP